jgi:hypothetical protein
MKYVIIGVIVITALILFLRHFGRGSDNETSAEVKPYSGPKPLLRQFGDLTPADFERHPVWVNCHGIDYDEPWYEETDEETFRPWLKSTPADPAETMFLVRASLLLADGTKLSGFITPQHPQENEGKPDFGLIQPQLFLPNGKRVPFWFGIMTPPKELMADMYTSLGKTESQVFPLAFTAEEGLALGTVSGTVYGFCSRGKGNQVAVYK